MLTLDAFVGFVSLVVFPLLGVLSVLKIRVAPYLVALLVVWLLGGVIGIGGGVTPIGKGDIVTKEEREAWFRGPIVARMLRVWLTGLGIGSGLLLTTAFFEKWSQSPYYRIAWGALKIFTFLTGFVAFLRIYVTTQ